MDHSGQVVWIALFFAAFGSILVDSEDIFAERGTKKVITCTLKTPVSTGKCYWRTSTGSVINSDKTFPTGYSIDTKRIPRSSCDLIIATAKNIDTGRWSCEASDNHPITIDVTVGAKPISNYFVYNGNRVVTNEYTKIGVTPKKNTGQVDIQCVSTNAYPAADITWEIDRVGYNNSTMFTTNNTATNTLTVTSTIGLRYSNQTKAGINEADYEKSVTCVVRHMGYGKAGQRISRTFVQNHPTTEANLMLVKDADVLLVCSANGFPMPNYEIHLINEETKDSIGDPFYTDRQKVTKGGVYVCKAIYSLKNDKPLAVVSNEVTVKIGGPNSASTSKPVLWTFAAAFAAIVLRRFLGC